MAIPSLLNSTDALPMNQWVVCQLGAREHYAIPRALVELNRLSALCTDVWSSNIAQILGRGTGRRGRAMAARQHSGIPTRLVKSWSFQAIGREFCSRVKHASHYDRYIADGAWFGSLIRDWLDTRPGAPDVIFSYDTTAFEPFVWGSDHGSRLILGQMDPGRFEAEIVANEREIWPGWEHEALQVPEAYHARRAAEWELADTIVVNSCWSRQALVRQGVPEAKLRVIPLVYESAGSIRHEGITEKRQGPLKLLFLGQVNLRKGIPYLLEAARMASSAVEITVVGPVQISREAVASAPANVRFTGPVSRSEVAAYYRKADAFVLPTLSDGFAITQLEAMAHGLPVIATPNCGEVVTDRVDGLIVPAADAAQLADAIKTLATDYNLLQEMSAQAVLKSTNFTVDRLVKALGNL